MTKLSIAIFLFFSVCSFSQKPQLFDRFEGVKSTINAKIHIVKSESYKAVVTGDSYLSSTIQLDLEDSTLKLRSASIDRNYEGILVTVYMPTIQVLALVNGGELTMDEEFSRVPTLVVSAENKALVNLSNIDFNTLIMSTTKGSQVLYKSVQTVIKTSNNGAGVRVSN
ncbi:MAG: DUF2807 domain-containing protein [Maribacter sp.]|uniref:GIN domain-containing protein n=1 Tax=Maribacter sp. TaxID=1897614 RepID=UPI00329A44C2